MLPYTTLIEFISPQIAHHAAAPNKALNRSIDCLAGAPRLQFTTVLLFMGSILSHTGSGDPLLLRDSRRALKEI